MDILPVSLVLISAVMHAGWNLVVRGEREVEIFLHIPAIIATVGLGPVLLAEFVSFPIASIVWRYFPLAGMFQAMYYLGLTRGYRSGDFTVVYPVARAAPVLLVAGADLVRGRPPTPIGWLGLLLVSAGCILAPLESLRDFSLARYWNRTTIWIAIAAIATVGYTVVDSAAAEVLPPGVGTALRYHVLESSFSLLAYWMILKSLRQPTHYEAGWAAWKLPAIAAIFLFGAYTLILWAYQLSPHTSYIVAIRQFSIVLGVVAAAFMFREPAAGLRISAALIIVLGIFLIALAG